MSNLSSWIKEIRANFLALSVILVIYGTSIAFWHDFFNLKYFIIALIGLIALHIAVNVLNEYSDFKSGLDFMTIKTPFSGGSGMLPEGRLNPVHVLILGIICCIIGAGAGVYFFILYGTAFLPIIILGGVAVIFYSTVLSRIMLGELFAGLGLGFLPVLGAYFVQTGFYSWEAILSAIPSGILTLNLLLLNEFPDYEPDKKVGKKNFVILLGKKKAAGLYALLTILTYIVIAFSIMFRFMPYSCVIAFLTLPLAIKAMRGAVMNHHSREGIIPAMGANVMVVLGTQFLLAVGYIFARFI
ncbi:MAG: prenyltransferase [Armatimonadota bacterium]